MTHEETRKKIEELLRDILDDESIILTDLTTTEDIADWDSTNHVRLIVAIEQEFGIHFDTEEFGGPENVGAMVRLVQAKVHREK
jgi:acyl carrier protein